MSDLNYTPTAAEDAAYWLAVEDGISARLNSTLPGAAEVDVETWLWSDVTRILVQHWPERYDPERREPDALAGRIYDHLIRPALDADTVGDEFDY